MTKIGCDLQKGIKEICAPRDTRKCKSTTKMGSLTTTHRPGWSTTPGLPNIDRIKKIIKSIGSKLGGAAALLGGLVASSGGAVHLFVGLCGGFVAWCGSVPESLVPLSNRSNRSHISNTFCIDRRPPCARLKI